MSLTKSLSVFFLMSLTKDVSIMLYLFKETNLSFSDLFYFLVYFCSDLYNIISTKFGLCLFFFLIPLSIYLDCLFEIFLLERGLYHNKISSLYCFCFILWILNSCASIFICLKVFFLISFLIYPSAYFVFSSMLLSFHVFYFFQLFLVINF